MIALLVALCAQAAEPVELFVGYRARYTVWDEALAGGTSVLLEHDDTLPDDQNAVFQAGLELDPAVYQIIDVSLSAMDKVYVRALVDFDAEALELARLAGRVGWKKARLHLESGQTSGRIVPDPLDPPDRILVPTRDVEISYRLLAVAAEIEPGVLVGVGTASWTLPTTLELFGPDAREDPAFGDYQGSFAVVDPELGYTLLGFFMDIRNVDRLLQDDPAGGDTPFLYADLGKARVGVGLELSLLLGLTRTKPDYGRYDQWVEHSGLRPDLRSAYGIGTMTSLRAGGVVALVPGRLRVGLDVGAEARSHILLALNPGGDGQPADERGTAWISYGDLLPMSVFYGPYAGVTAAF